MGRADCVLFSGAMQGKLYIGTAGWSYPDWKGIVYPRTGSFDELGLLSGMFDTVEVNNTFYRPPTPSMTHEWLQRIKKNGRFMFTVKLFRHFTHNRDKLDQADETIFKKGLRPLIKAEKLGALLVQFPYSFHNTPENKKILVDVFNRFADYPLVLEIRHRSWDTPVVMGSLLRHGVGFCNLDQPHISYSIGSTNHVTSPVAYLRLHGRNKEQWFKPDAGAQRYNYLYTSEQLTGLTPLIKKLRSRAESVFVITNNHWGGQAVANALQIQFLASGREAAVPETLAKRYPQVKDTYGKPFPDNG